MNAPKPSEQGPAPANAEPNMDRFKDSAKLLTQAHHTYLYEPPRVWWRV